MGGLRIMLRNGSRIKKNWFWLQKCPFDRLFEHVTKISCTTFHAAKSYILKVISDLVIILQDEFEIFDDHLDQKRPRTFKIYGLDF